MKRIVCRLFSLALLSALQIAVGCTGNIVEKSMRTPGDAPPVPLSPGAFEAPLRRLSPVEYLNTVRDLLGTTVPPSINFPEEELRLGFDNNVLSQLVTGAHAAAYQLAAEALAEQATQNLPARLGCEISSLSVTEQTSCIDAFIRRTGQRAFRRPLSSSEVTRLTALFQAGKTGGTTAEGVQWVLSALLESPHFLYRPELGALGDPNDLRVALTAYEQATRLSYFLWQTMPDDALLATAARGELSSREQVEAQAVRMLSDPRARSASTEFFLQWFQLTRLDAITKDPAGFPLFDDALKVSMGEEARRLVEHIVWNGTGTLKELLTADYSFLDGPLASLYGVAGVSGPGFARVSLNPNQRAGLLTNAAVMTQLSGDFQTSPIRRGLFVREKLLCQTPPPPPPNVAALLPPPMAGVSSRARFEQHRADPTCFSCHQYFDSIGFGLEAYDAVGRYRTSETVMGTSIPLDVSGEVRPLVAGQDVQGPFVGAIELARMLSVSEDVRRCMARRLFRFTFGRAEAPDDLPTIESAHQNSSANGGQIRALLVGFVRSEAFRYRAKITPEGSP